MSCRMAMERNRQASQHFEDDWVYDQKRKVAAMSWSYRIYEGNRADDQKSIFYAKSWDCDKECCTNEGTWGTTRNASPMPSPGTRTRIVVSTSMEYYRDCMVMCHGYTEYENVKGHFG